MNAIWKRFIQVASVAVFAAMVTGFVIFMRLTWAMHADPCPDPQRHVAETGFEAINRDARAVFDQLSPTNSALFYYLDSLDPFPALRDLKQRLGNYSSIVIEPRRGGEPEHIRIRCGNHFNCHFIYVFDPRISLDTNSSMFQGWQRITNNVFLRM